MYISKDMTKETKWVADEKITEILKSTGKFRSLEENMMFMAEEGKIDEAMQLYRETLPKRFIRDHISMRKSLKSIYEQKVGIRPSEYRLKDFTIPKKLEILFNKWKENNFEKTILLIGKPGCGKTEYVKTWMNDSGYKPLIVTNKDGLRYLSDSDKKYTAIIYDDVDFSHESMTRETIIGLLDSNERTIDIKHGSILIPKRIPKVVTSNVDYTQDIKNPMFKGVTKAGVPALSVKIDGDYSILLF